MTETKNGAKKEVRDPSKPKTLKERLDDKKGQLEKILPQVAARLRLSEENLKVQIIDDRLVIRGQYRLLRKSERLKGVVNSEEEIEPPPTVARHRRKKARNR